MKKQFKKYAALYAVLPCLLINSLSLTASAINVNLSDYGDVNDDGSINVFDTNMIQKYMNGTTSLSPWQCVYADLNANVYVDSGDVNYDGIISVEDAVQVLGYYAKKSASLSVDWE